MPWLLADGDSFIAPSMTLKRSEVMVLLFDSDAVEIEYNDYLSAFIKEFRHSPRTIRGRD